MNFLTVFLGRITNRFLGETTQGAFEGSQGNTGTTDKNSEWMDVLRVLLRLIDQFLPVAMILLGLVGSIYVIVLGVKYAKTEGSDDKNEIKKKLINAGIGIGIGLLIMIVMKVFLDNSSAIATWLTDAAGKEE